MKTRNNITRRDTLAILGASAARIAVGAPEQPLRIASLDHVAIAVPDVEKSLAFYSRIFAHEVMKDSRTSRRYFKIGSAYVAIAPPAEGQPSRRVDHFCLGVAGFDAKQAKSELDRRGIASREAAVGLYVTDPDGLQVQLWDDPSWSRAVRAAAPEATRPGEAPLFRPRFIDHLLLRVSAMEKSAAFYQRLFGAEPRRSPNPPRIWFQAGTGRLGLAPVGAGPAVDHFCVAVDSIDRATVTKQLQDRGAVPQPAETPASPVFADPDGILVQVSQASSRS